MQNEFSTIIHNLVLDSPIAAKDLAKAIGKPYSTLLREVNPYDTGAKLGAETLFQIMAITGNLKPIEYMSEKLNMGFIPTNKDFPHVTPGAFEGRSEMSMQNGQDVCPTCGQQHAMNSQKANQENAERRI